MDIKVIIIVGFSYLYGFFELFMNLRNRNKSRVTSSGDKGSLWMLYGMITTGYFLSFAIGMTKIGRIYHWNTFFAIGAVLVVIGLIIRIMSIMTLRQYFTYSVANVEDHQLIETGLYKNIRHPGYLGQLLIFLGISISIIQLVIHSIDDDPDHDRIHLPYECGGKIYGRTTWRKVYKLSKTYQENYPSGLLRSADLTSMTNKIKQKGDMMSNNSISLPDVAETGMLTFYCHVIESQSPDPILRDEKAVEISHQLSPVFANSSSRLLRNLAKGKVKKELVTHITLRAKKYDEYVNVIFERKPRWHHRKYRLRDGFALSSDR